MKILKIVFNKIVNQLYKTIYDKKYSVNEKNNSFSGSVQNSNIHTNNSVNSYELLNPEARMTLKLSITSWSGSSQL
jgi:hypothetical protein